MMAICSLRWIVSGRDLSNYSRALQVQAWYPFALCLVQQPELAKVVGRLLQLSLCASLKYFWAN